jgi:hypothetical protein
MFSKELIDVYKNEELATEAFKEYRVKKGISCKKCGSHQHYWLNSKFQFQCRACRFRTTLRSGSVLEGSKLPYSYFFIAVHLLIKHGNTLTIDDFQKYTGHKYYDPLWVFLRKIKIYIKEDNAVLLDFVEVVNQHFIQYNESNAVKELVKEKVYES